jgi:membrane protein required for colicin V production
MLEKAVNLVQLKLINKAMGALFGVAKIVLVISVLLVIVNSFDEKANIVPKDLKDNSLLYQPLSDVSFKVIPALKNSGLFSDSATGLSLDTVTIAYTQ